MAKKPPGPAFKDEVAKITGKTGHFQKSFFSDWTDSLIPHFRPAEEDAGGKNPWKVIAYAGVCALLFFIIFVRLFHLQIVRGEQNRNLADGNRIQVKIIHAPRGVIYDRNGQILGANSPAFRYTDNSSGKTKIRHILREQAIEWEVNSDPRFADLEVDNIRNYPKGEVYAHLLGYMGEISEEQLKKEEFKNYRAGDQVGQSGIEAQYEKFLRGRDGGEIIEVDSKGRKIRTLRYESPVPGKNLHLAIDGGLQEKLYETMKKTLEDTGSCCGAFIAGDPQTGKILSLASFPSFDPNVFSRMDEGGIREIFSRPQSPVLNRAIAGTYPPGSTFKIVSSLAALSSGKLKSSSVFEDTGVMFLGPYKFSNWYFNQYGKTEGSVDLIKALQRSNDIYFYKIAQIIGEKALWDWSAKLNLGKKSGIDLPGEEAGIVPDDEWKRKTYNQPWYPGDTLHMSIGQGFVLATPLQIHQISSFIAANGNMLLPQIVLADKPKVLISDIAGKEMINPVKEGLKSVPREGGTAWPFFTFPVSTAGKTGTAEYGDPKGKTHAWYTSFAPSNEPKIAITVLVEGGGEGSSVAAPIAKEGYRWYFSPDKNRLIQDKYAPASASAQSAGE